MRVYLAGPINGCDDHEAKMWRLIASDHLTRIGYEVLDPMRRDYRGREAGNEAEIVEADLADIDSCDVVLANCERPSVGTSMEVLHAARKGAVVVAFAKNPSPWLSYHATVTPDLTTALRQLDVEASNEA